MTAHIQRRDWTGQSRCPKGLGQTDALRETVLKFGTSRQYLSEMRRRRVSRHQPDTSDNRGRKKREHTGNPKNRYRRDEAKICDPDVRHLKIFESEAILKTGLKLRCGAKVQFHAEKGTHSNWSQEQSSEDNTNTTEKLLSHQQIPAVRGAGHRGNDKLTPLTMTNNEILATEGSKLHKTSHQMRTPEEAKPWGTDTAEYNRQKGYTTNEAFQLRQLIGQIWSMEGILDHLVKNIKEGKDKLIGAAARKTHLRQG
ncbi:hypothetical protein Tco_0710954 [Tanacetum coccineum]